jgi:Sec7-like guanine-nucleotide exchange factor
MNRIISLSSAIVVLAATALGAAGCASKNESPFDIEKQAFDDVRAEIQSIVSDPERAEKAIDLATALEQSIDDTKKDVEARRAKIRELNADYDRSGKGKQPGDGCSNKILAINLVRSG